MSNPGVKLLLQAFCLTFLGFCSQSANAQGDPPPVVPTAPVVDAPKPTPVQVQQLNVTPIQNQVQIPTNIVQPLGTISPLDVNKQTDSPHKPQENGPGISLQSTTQPAITNSNLMGNATDQAKLFAKIENELKGLLTQIQNTQDPNERRRLINAFVEVFKYAIQAGLSQFGGNDAIAAELELLVKVNSPDLQIQLMTLLHQQLKNQIALQSAPSDQILTSLKADQAKLNQISKELIAAGVAQVKAASLPVNTSNTVVTNITPPVPERTKSPVPTITIVSATPKPAAANPTPIPTSTATTVKSSSGISVGTIGSGGDLVNAMNLMIQSSEALDAAAREQKLANLSMAQANLANAITNQTKSVTPTEILQDRIAAISSIVAASNGTKPSGGATSTVGSANGNSTTSSGLATTSSAITGVGSTVSGNGFGLGLTPELAAKASSITTAAGKLSEINAALNANEAKLNALNSQLSALKGPAILSPQTMGLRIQQSALLATVVSQKEQKAVAEKNFMAAVTQMGGNVASDKLSEAITGKNLNTEQLVAAAALNSPTLGLVIDLSSGDHSMDMLRLQSLSNKRNEAFEIMTNFIQKMNSNTAS